MFGSGLPVPPSLQRENLAARPRAPQGRFSRSSGKGGFDRLPQAGSERSLAGSGEKPHKGLPSDSPSEPEAGAVEVGGGVGGGESTMEVPHVAGLHNIPLPSSFVPFTSLEPERVKPLL